MPRSTQSSRLSPRQPRARSRSPRPRSFTLRPLAGPRRPTARSDRPRPRLLLPRRTGTILALSRTICRSVLKNRTVGAAGARPPRVQRGTQRERASWRASAGGRETPGQNGMIKVAMDMAGKKMADLLKPSASRHPRRYLSFSRLTLSLALALLSCPSKEGSSAPNSGR